jgi:hypothetical protein
MLPGHARETEKIKFEIFVKYLPGTSPSAKETGSPSQRVAILSMYNNGRMNAIHRVAGGAASGFKSCSIPAPFADGARPPSILSIVLRIGILYEN